MKHITKTITILNILFLLSPINASERFSSYDFNPDARSKRLAGQVESYITKTRGVNITQITEQVRIRIHSSSYFREKLELLEWIEKSSHSKKTTLQSELPGFIAHLFTEIPQALRNSNLSFQLKLGFYEWADAKGASTQKKEWLDILLGDLNFLSIENKRKLSARYKKLTLTPETNPRKTILESIFNDADAKDDDRSKSCEELRLMGFADLANQLRSTYAAEQQRLKNIEIEAKRLRELQRLETLRIEEELRIATEVEAARARAIEEAARIKAEEERIQAEEDKLLDDDWEKIKPEDQKV